MPYWQASDTHHDDPIWAALAQGRLDVVDRLQAAWARLMSIASRQRSDGYLTTYSALEQCRGKQGTLDALCSRPLADVAPMLHRRGDSCPCLDDDWREGYDLRLHGFLKRNPSRRENDRNKTQEAERRDPRIRHEVYVRDGGCCRYCESGPIPRKGMGRAKDRRRVLHLDHVDPDKTAGDDLANLVTACGRCNQEKGHRTPAEAEMVLLPTPAPERATQLLTRPEELHELPAAPAGAVVDNRAEHIDNDIDNAPTTPRQRDGALSAPLSRPLSVDDDVDVGHGPSTATTTAQPYPQHPADVPGQPPPPSGSCVGSGGVGPPQVSRCPEPPDLPARGPTETDIYHRRSRGETR